VKLTLIVTVQSAADVELSQRLVAGQPWIVHLVGRLQRATSVVRVMVACCERASEVASAMDSGSVSVVSTSEPAALAREIDGDHDGVVLCPVAQLFADPRRLDAVAALDMPADTARAFAVLLCDPTIALTGGAFLEVITRFGLRALSMGDDLSQLKTAVWHTWPEPPEMRLKTWGDFDWAILAAEALLARDPSGVLDQFEEAMDDSGLRRFAFWDEMGPPPQSILTIRCLRQPLFEHFVRFLNRLRGITIDVVCRSDQAEQTRTLHGVGRVMTFDAPAFSMDALGSETLDSIRARCYDLCVVPRREPTGWGFDNVVPLAKASGASAAIWLDIFGGTGLLAGRAQGWDAATLGGPQERGEAYLRRAVRALDRYEKTPDREVGRRASAVR
jgi:hypothetical protein